MDQKVKNARILFKVLAMFTAMFFVMAVVYGIMNGNLNDMIPGFIRILRSPAQCTQDMYGVSVPGTYFNMGMCCLLMLVYIVCCGGKDSVNSGTVAAFFLTVGFSSWGMNIINMLPLMIGMQVYALIKKKTPASMMNLGIFATAIAPIMSEVMFRWPGYNATVDGVANVNTTSLNAFKESGLEVLSNLPIQPTGILIAFIIAILFCLFYPALCAKAPNFHMGCDLFNAGPPAGFLCLMTIGFLFKVTNIGTGISNGPGQSSVEVFEFVFISYAIVFLICFIIGLALDKDALKNYGKLLKDSGQGSDFIEKYGIGAAMINFAIYGLFILLFYTCMKYCFGAKFSGPVAGVVWCAFTWVAAGAHPLNVLPIGIGYVLISLVSTQVCPALGIGADTGRLGMSTVGILIAFSYATGMAPISGKYGVIWGILAGVMHFAIVTLIPLQYNFFNFYNGGFTAGVVAFVLVPFIEHYFIKEAK